MAIKHKGSGVFTYNLDIQAPKPFDSRLVVESYSADLAGENYKSTFVLGGANAWYDGMLVYAEDTKKVYVLKGEEGFVEVGPELPENAYKNTTYVIEESEENGKITIIPSDGDAYDVPVHGLQDAAYTTVATLESTMDTKDAAILAAAKKYADDNDSDTTYAFAEGTVNGEFVVTPKGGTPQQVKVHGLGSAAYTQSTDYDAAGAAEAVKTSLVNGETDFADFKAVGDELRALEQTAGAKVADVTVGGVSVVNTDTHVAVLGTAAGKAIDDFDAAGAAAKALEDANDYTDGVKDAIIGDATTAGDTLGKLEDRIEAIVANEKTYSVVKMTDKEVTDLGNANVKEAYKLIDEDKTTVGDPILIYKDSSLKSAAMGTGDNAQKLMLTYILADGSESEVPVDLSAFYAESETGAGLQLINHVISVKRDDASEAFLTVSANGVKLSGVQDAIDTAIQALDAEVTSTDGAKVTVKVTEVDGKITAVNVTESDIASAQDLSDLATVVNDNEQVTAAALNDLNERIEAVADSIPTELGVMSVAKGTDGEFVTTTIGGTDAEPTVGVAVEIAEDVVSTKLPSGYESISASGLVTDKYVQDYVASQMQWAAF